MFEKLRYKTHEDWYLEKLGCIADICRETISAVKSNGPSEKKAESAKALEHKADLIVQEIVQALHSADKQLQPTFLPLKSRIIELAHVVDDTVDETEKAANRMDLYDVGLDKELFELLTLADNAAENIKSALQALAKAYQSRKIKDYDLVTAFCDEIKRIESMADEVYRGKIRSLVQSALERINKLREDPDALMTNSEAADMFMLLLQFVGRKEVLEIYERALDKSQEVADKIEGLSHELQ